MARADALAATTSDRQLVADRRRPPRRRRRPGRRTSPATTSPTTPTASSSPGSPPPATRADPTRKDPSMSTAHRPHRHAPRAPASTVAEPGLAPAVVPVAAHRPRLPARRLHRPRSSPAASTRCRPPSSAGSIAGAGIGAAQWALLPPSRRRVTWIPATAARPRRRARRRGRARLATAPTSVARRHGRRVRTRRRHSAQAPSLEQRPTACSVGRDHRRAVGPRLGVTTAGRHRRRRSSGPCSAPPAASRSVPQSTVIGASCHEPDRIDPRARSHQPTTGR